MDQVTFLIFNAILTGLLIFGFQKYWEYRYERKKFEHQVKFQRIHEKRVTTLETLFQMYSEFVTALNSLQMHADLAYRMKEPLNSKSLREKRIASSDKIHEARRYLESNGLHLPNNIQFILTDVITESIHLEIMTFELIFRSDWDKELEPEKIKEFTDAFIFADSTYLPIPIKDIPSLLHAISMKSFSYMKVIDAVYKSVADTSED